MENVKDKQMKIFKLALGTTILAFLAIVALIVFAFILMEKMELYTCLAVGLGMVILIALVSFTLWIGLKAFRE